MRCEVWHLTPLAEQKFQRTQLGANFAQLASAAAAKTRKYSCRWEKIRKCSKINRSSIGIPRCRQFASPENQRARRARARALRYCSLQGNGFRAVRLEWVAWGEGDRQGQNICSHASYSAAHMALPLALQVGLKLLHGAGACHAGTKAELRCKGFMAVI